MIKWLVSPVVKRWRVARMILNWFMIAVKYSVTITPVKATGTTMGQLKNLNSRREGSSFRYRVRPPSKNGSNNWEFDSLAAETTHQRNENSWRRFREQCWPGHCHSRMRSVGNQARFSAEQCSTHHQQIWTKPVIRGKGVRRSKFVKFRRCIDCLCNSWDT